MNASARALYALVAVLAFGSLAAALFTQYQWDMQPCPWCVLQRLIFVFIGTVALLGCLLAGRPVRMAASLLVAVLAAGGVAAALWQHFVAAQSPSCNLTLADRIVGFFGVDTSLPAVFEVRASCAESAVDLLGLPYEFWSLGLFVLLAGLALLALRRP